MEIEPNSNINELQPSEQQVPSLIPDQKPLPQLNQSLSEIGDEVFGFFQAAVQPDEPLGLSVVARLKLIGDDQTFKRPPAYAASEQLQLVAECHHLGSVAGSGLEREDARGTGHGSEEDLALSV